MEYKLYFKINGKEKFLKEFSNYDDAFNYSVKHREKNSTIESHYIRMFKKNNIFKLDYGAHNAFYLIKEIE